MENVDKPSTAARRQFLADTARMACGVGLLGLGVGLYARHARALPPAAIRPPGALPEVEFSAACIRCGMCVRDCPFDILHLAKPEEPLSTGTPYFVARQAPCEMCEDIPCVKTCPTGALNHALKDINKSKMGLAVLVDHETCLNFLGLRCDICYRVCPVIDKAITLDPQTNARTGKAHPVHTGGAFRPLHRLRQVRERPVLPRLPRSRSFRSTWPRASSARTTGSAGSRRKRPVAVWWRPTSSTNTTCRRA
jgi:ferredoxin-type protein NapG